MTCERLAWWSIGTINVPVDSVIKWTNDSSDFVIYDSENGVEVSSQPCSGQSDFALAPITVSRSPRIGIWTMDIVPK